MTSEIKNEYAAITFYSDSFNRRIRIDDYSGDQKDVLKLVIESIPGWTEKLIIKVRDNDLSFFMLHGFAKEAFIKGYFDGEDMHFLVRYFSETRSKNPKETDEQNIIDTILLQEKLYPEQDIQLVSVATRNDANELALLYSSVFKVYPTPLGDVAHMLKTFEEGTKYVVIREQDKIVSVASAEINHRYSNAELTDCATLPVAQGKGYMKKLLAKLEQILLDDHIRCLYTIARAESYGMNKVYYQLDYKYGGRMTNNCFIFSGLEDMNVWYKFSNV